MSDQLDQPENSAFKDELKAAVDKAREKRDSMDQALADRITALEQKLDDLIVLLKSKGIIE